MSLLKQTIYQSKSNHTAIGHFNFSTIEVLNAIVESAIDQSTPVILGVSEGEREFVGTHNVVALINSIKKSTSHPIFLNADHTYSFDNVRTVIDAGFDSVVFDGAKLDKLENIHITKECVTYAKNSGREVLIEAEIGYIGSSSSMLDSIPENAINSTRLMPSPETVKSFVNDTGVDLIAPAVGNLHGMLKDAQNPHLNLDLIQNITTSTSSPFVLHGGSGLTDDDFTKAIKAGVSVIHINTHLRKAWTDSLKSSLQSDPKQVAPYKILKKSKSSVKQVVTHYLHLFNKS